MGAAASLIITGPVTLAPVTQRDEQVEKWVEKIPLTDANVGTLWKIFSEVATNNVLNKANYFDLILGTPKTFLGEAIFKLIDRFDSHYLNFGEYVNITCTVCTLSRDELLQFCFNLMDFKRTGLINKDELTFFITSLWKDRKMQTHTAGFAYIEKASRYNLGYLDTVTIKDINRKFPQLFFPIFDLQLCYMDTSFGQKWWDDKVLALRERLAERRENKFTQLMEAVHGMSQKLLRGGEVKKEAEVNSSPVKKKKTKAVFGFLVGNVDDAQARQRKIQANERLHGLDKIGAVPIEGTQLILKEEAEGGTKKNKRTKKKSR